MFISGLVVWVFLVVTTGNTVSARRRLIRHLAIVEYPYLIQKELMNQPDEKVECFIGEAKRWKKVVTVRLWALIFALPAWTYIWYTLATR